MLLHVTIICLMIHGARKGSPRLILPWLIFGMLGILSLVAFGIMQMIGLEGTSEKAIFGCTTAVAACMLSLTNIMITIQFDHVSFKEN